MLCSFCLILPTEATCPWSDWCTGPYNWAVTYSETTGPESVKHKYHFSSTYCIVIFAWNNMDIMLSIFSDMCLSPLAGKSGWILKVLPHTVALISRLWSFFCDQEGQFLTPTHRKHGQCIRSQCTKLVPADESILNQHERHIYIDNFKLPQVLHAVQGAVAARQEVVQIFSEAQSFQPWGQRSAAVTPQSFHLKEE